MKPRTFFLLRCRSWFLTAQQVGNQRSGFGFPADGALAQVSVSYLHCLCLWDPTVAGGRGGGRPVVMGVTAWVTDGWVSLLCPGCLVSGHHCHGGGRGLLGKWGSRAQHAATRLSHPWLREAIGAASRLCHNQGREPDFQALTLLLPLALCRDAVRWLHPDSSLLPWAIGSAVASRDLSVDAAPSFPSRLPDTGQSTHLQMYGRAALSGTLACGPEAFRWVIDVPRAVDLRGDTKGSSHSTMMLTSLYGARSRQ